MKGTRIQRSDTMRTPDLNWLKDSRIFQVNRLQAYSDHKYTIGKDKKPSSFSLNGTWKFNQSKNYDTCFKFFYNTELVGEGKKYDLPTTWEEFWALGDQAKQDGISLFTYPLIKYSISVWLSSKPLFFLSIISYTFIFLLLSFHHLSAFPVKPVFLSCPTLALFYIFWPKSFWQQIP